MYKDQNAARLRLGLPVNKQLTKQEIDEAYAKVIKMDHPDHGGAGSMLSRYKKDRNWLISQATDMTECPKCGGAGYV